ncbi:hypothetical protein GIB67_028698 [Kingdonia uniflora]|uniref:Aldehyde dehydrogenase domain-containing protein n=1 Tax=Kingdonia uniflora TaxID=39325 RepID=A0A7J7NAD8_9MAGN|nr:hypothetical protein GIB67_028698 [Kingdonia uniflora]
MFLDAVLPATRAQLWSLNQSFVKSKRLLVKTNTAVEMLNYGGSGGMDFSGIDVALVESAIRRASRGSAVYGNEALAIVSFMIFCQALQYNVKVAINEGVDWYNCFMSLTEVIMELVVNQSLVKSIQQVVDKEGSVRDYALNQLMDSLIRDDLNGTTFGEGSLVEPLSAVPLNDDVTARAKYSLSFRGTAPNLFSTDNKDGFSTGSSHPTQLEWTLYLPNSYHPLLLQWHKKNLLKAKMDVSNAIAVSAICKSGWNFSKIIELNFEQFGSMDGNNKVCAPLQTLLPLVIFPATGDVLPEPLGVVLILSSWNYPISLALDPLIGAIATGNAVVLKPSELAPACSALLANTIPSYMDDKVVMVVEGGASVGKQLLDQKWDKIFFIGKHSY